MNSIFSFYNLVLKIIFLSLLISQLFLNSHKFVTILYETTHKMIW